MKIELRKIDTKLVGSETDELLFVSGYVNKTGQWSQMLGKTTRFKERIEKGVFQRAIDEATDIAFLAEHDPQKILSSTKAGSLTLREDENGLYMEARISPTTWGRDYHQLIKDKLLEGMSFGMRVLKDNWNKLADGTYERSISQLQLFEITATRNPAYLQSQIQARSIEVVEDPKIEERNFETMTLKELYQIKQSKVREYKQLINTAKSENRNLDSEETAQEKILEIEIRELNEEIEKLEKANKPKGVTNTMNNFEFEQEKRALEQFIKREFNGEELRAITVSDPGQTGSALIIPTHLSNLIVEKLYERAPIFSRTRNFTPVNGYLEILKEGFHGTAAFVGEMAENVTPSDFTMAKVKLDQKRVVSAIELSQHLINDSGIDVVDYAVKMLVKRIGQAIDTNVLRGQKDNGQFEGILTTAITDIDKVAAASGSAITLDELYDLYLSMNPEYLDGAVWVVSRKTFNMIAKLKDNDGKYFLVPNVASTGTVYKLFGQPVLIQEAMPDHKAGAGRTVVFANFGEGYATMTKKGLNLKHIDNDSKQALRGSALLVLDGYMDGKILNEDAIRCLKAPAV
ncbi:phage major capsid protein [Cytobacillus sp. S13-E01]|uniref:phage major capsid protein n=1 Tax=Cytobacillus sp. S13-E01 TaxID=3031326 RepID=UPI0023D810BE|nr:phage major capsid protein [Cytobacillus sp. S13-E01]MDF0727254.1 phage major capsid protein [Cytobacillus sp. S13-E01]